MTQLQEAIRDKITKYSDACGMCTDITKECDACDVEGILEDLNELQKLADNPDAIRPTAHWIKRGYVCGENEYECSACHETEWRTSASRMKYCMFCGARLVNTDEKHCT